MFKLHLLACVGSAALAMSSAPAIAQPSPATAGLDPSTPAGAIEQRIAEARARAVNGQCSPEEFERIAAINRDAKALAKSVMKAFEAGAPLDRANGKAAVDAAAHAQALYDEAEKGCIAPPKKPAKTPSDAGDTIVPQPPLAPAEVFGQPTRPGSETNGLSVEYQLDQRLRQLQEKVRNSYCDSPELHKELEELRRDLDKATRALDPKKSVDRYKLYEHERISRELSDLEAALRKLPQACGPKESPQFPPPTQPLGGSGDLGVNCNEKDRTDERLKLQQDLLKLQEELIKIDGTTPAGRARQIEVQREIKRIEDVIELLKQPCPEKKRVDSAKPRQTGGEPISHRDQPPTQPKQSTDQSDHRFAPPTTPLGGKQPAGCTEKERIDERQRLQEEVIKLEGELIRTDGTTPAGRARQIELQREIKQATDELERLREQCPRQTGSRTSRAPDVVNDVRRSNELVDVGETSHRHEPSSNTQPARDDCALAEDFHACTTGKPKTSAKQDLQKIKIPVTYELLVKHLADVKESRTHFTPTNGEIDERLVRMTRLIDSLKDLEDAKRLGQKIGPDAQEAFYEDINEWLSELEDDIATQPWAPTRIGQSNVQPPAEPSLESRIGELAKILKLINEDRARYGVPPLTWDDKLALHAREWAEQLPKIYAETRTMPHAPREGRGLERENLAQGLPGWTVERLVQLWRDEEKNYVPGKFPNVALDGDWQKVAHWTQDISRLSQEIGCAIARGSGFQWLVCRFSPGGNKDGEMFGPPVAAKPLDARAAVANDFKVEQTPVETEMYAIQAAIGSERERLAARDPDFKFCYPEDEQKGLELTKRAEVLVESLTAAQERGGKPSPAAQRQLEEAKRVAADAQRFYYSLGSRWGCGT